jgi:hypothetical protein
MLAHACYLGVLAAASAASAAEVLLQARSMHSKETRGCCPRRVVQASSSCGTCRCLKVRKNVMK